MAFDVCGVPNPDVPTIRCDLPANHARTKELWLYGQWMDHLSRADNNTGWVIPPNDERDDVIVTSVATAMTESADFVELLVQGLLANGYEITKRPTGSPTTGAHTGS
jgi:hypothetical protein